MDKLIDFLLEAKSNTYASNGMISTPSRPYSIDYHYRKEPFHYIDSYLGEINFSGEEIIYYDHKACWSMNYFGEMLIDKIPDGFYKCLKNALKQSSKDAPFRGPQEYFEGDFIYETSYKGTMDSFNGLEHIFYRGQLIYQLFFHGGKIIYA